MTGERHYEIEPYTTTNIPEAGISVYHDGDEESWVTVQGGEARLGDTTGRWVVQAHIVARGAS